jgi:regulator of ribonuclease activity A
MTSTADLYDEREEELQSCQTQFRQFGGRADFAGRIVTVRCANDNALVKKLLTTTDGAGRVLVVDGGGSLASALMGDLIAKGAVDRGWEGVVINGPVRDSVELATLDLGVKALGTNPRKSAKDGAGEVDVDVEFGGVVFRPGRHLWSDADGILVER